MSTSCPVEISAAHAATAPDGMLGKEISKADAQKSNWGSSTRDAMLDYIKRNNDDLTIEEAAVKFGLSETTAARYLSMLAGAGQVERVSVYRMKGSQ